MKNATQLSLFKQGDLVPLKSSDLGSLHPGRTPANHRNLLRHGCRESSKCFLGP